METFVAVLHLFVALVLIALVLVQDSKSGGMGGAFGGGGSGSVFGATGAATLAQQATRVAAIIFAATCIGLTYFSARGQKGVTDDVALPAASIPAATSPAAAPSATPGAAESNPPAASPETATKTK